MRTLRREAFGIVTFVVLSIVILGPMLTVILWAFAERWRYPSLVPTVWGLSYWSETFGRADILSALPVSLALSLTVTALAAVICLPAAYAFARMNFRGRQFLLLSFLATNAFPRFGLYVSIAVVFFRLHLVGTFAGVVLIQLVNTLLTMIWIPTSAFGNVDRAHWRKPPQDMGASPLRVFVQITLPMVFPALAAALAAHVSSARFTNRKAHCLSVCPTFAPCPSSCIRLRTMPWSCNMAR